MTTAVTYGVRDDGYAIASWGPLLLNETGIAANLGRVAGIKTVQISGTFSGQTVNLQGSMDGVTWFTLHSLDFDTGDYASLGAIAAAYMSSIVENPIYIRPIVSNGGAPSLTVIVGGYTRT